MLQVETKTGGEKATIVKGDVVIMQHTTLHKATDTNYAMTTTFDFAGVSRDDILKCAAEMLLIRWRTAFKNSEAVDESSDNQTVKVVEMLAKGRKKLSKTEKVKKLGLSVEDLKKLLAEAEESEEG